MLSLDVCYCPQVHGIHPKREHTKIKWSSKESWNFYDFIISHTHAQIPIFEINSSLSLYHVKSVMAWWIWRHIRLVHGHALSFHHSDDVNEIDAPKIASLNLNIIMKWNAHKFCRFETWNRRPHQRHSEQVSTNNNTCSSFTCWMRTHGMCLHVVHVCLCHSNGEEIVSEPRTMHSSVRL